ncbi:MAG: hypothetical protein KAJ10_05560 [Thermodesulfovibrionia bacterium]|nr:hypothetical protein [Thermodesulfovibrionia bacterium]
MTSKQRFIAAMQNKVPDRVPVTPATSCYIPCSRLGIPFWDTLFYEKVPLLQAYLDTADYFGFDAWTGGHMGLALKYEKPKCEEKINIYYDKDRDAMIRDRLINTPDGTLSSKEICFRFDPPTMTEKPIKNLIEDWPKFRHTLNIPVDYDRSLVEVYRNECAKRNHAFGLGLGYPGFQIWHCFIQDGLKQLSYALCDKPQIIDKWFELDMEIGTKTMEMTISERPDYIFLGGSGTITMASPQLALKYAIPALKKWSRMAKDAGIPTLLHSCGKQSALLELLVEHTDVSCVNPLEVPPMGDVILAEAKKKYGDKIALMGNLHTTQTMLFGSAEDVIEASINAMKDAGQNGGFILSTGDQCGRETPDENIFAMVEAVNKYGHYDEKGRLVNLPD